MTESKRVAERAVERFHSQIDAEQYRQIYLEADSEFHKLASEADFAAFLKDVHQKLGRTRQARQVGYQVNTQLGAGTVVTLSYQTQFANEVVAEQFTWRVIGDKARLVRYDIESGESSTKQ